MGAIFIVRKVNKTVLNMSFNGVAIKGKYQIIELIENMKLPIKIKK